MKRTQLLSIREQGATLEYEKTYDRAKPGLPHTATMATQIPAKVGAKNREAGLFSF